jgi:cell wall-associated NlpC family hydrolase
MYDIFKEAFMKSSGKMWTKVRRIVYPLILPLFMSCVTLMPEKAKGVPGLPAQLPPENKAALRQSILSEGEKYIDTPYASPPNVPVTFDCSGFVNHVFTKAVNMRLSTTTKDYLTLGKEIDFKDAKPGDVLVFTSEPGGSNADHVAILYKKSAAGELRGSLLIHAVSIPVQSAAIRGNPNKAGVVIGEMGKRGDGIWQKEYFLSRYKCTRRFIEE